MAKSILDLEIKQSHIDAAVERTKNHPPAYCSSCIIAQALLDEGYTDVNVGTYLVDAWTKDGHPFHAENSIEGYAITRLEHEDWHKVKPQTIRFFKVGAGPTMDEITAIDG